MFKRIANFCYERRRLVLGLWFLLLIGLGVLSGVAGGKTKTEFRLPGSESQEAFDILKTRGFAERSGESARIVWKADQGVKDPAVRTTMEKFFQDVLAIVPRSAVVSPYESGNERQISQDGKIAYAELNLEQRPFEEFPDIGTKVRD